MIDINYIRENPEQFESYMRDRNTQISSNTILSTDKEKREKLNKLQALQTDRNSISKLIGIHKSKNLETTDLEKKVSDIKKKYA